MLRILLVILVNYYAAISFGQEVSSFKFDAQIQYAGARDPGETAIEFTYMFTNTGSIPIQVSGVNPCNRCDVVAISRGLIRPGGRGFVAIKYQLPNQPGRFMENFQVFMNNNLNKPVKLSFSGELLPAPKDKSQIFAYCLSDLCFRDETLDLGRVLHTGFLTKEFPVYNGGNMPLDLGGPPLHPFLSAELQPAPLMPGEKGKLTITMRASNRQAYGPVYDTLRLYSRSEDIAPIDVLLKTHIDEDFSKLKPDQLTISPLLSFTETRHDIGAIKRGEETTCRFEVKNKGKRQLIVRSLVTSSPMLQVEMPNRSLRYNQTGEIVVTLTASAPKGQFLETVTIICNDPKRPEANLYIQGVIVE